MKLTSDDKDAIFVVLILLGLLVYTFVKFAPLLFK